MKVVAGMSFGRVLEGNEFCAHLETPVNLDHVVCGDRHVRPFEKVRPDVGSERDAAESVLLRDSELLYNARQVIGPTPISLMSSSYRRLKW
jgi:hypothetical protein